MNKHIREQVIIALAAGDYVSGQQLGDDLGISRAAVLKHINALADMGLDIFRTSGKGYKLSQPLNLLSHSKITKQLLAFNKSNDVSVHHVIDSTNSHLMRCITEDTENTMSQGQTCVAEYQSAGRGRRGRQWVSPYGSHLYLSYYWRLDQGMSAAMGLSLVAAIAVSDAVKQCFDIDVQLKWPNDIYINGVKLAGILIELEGQMSGLSHSVIGIGLNLNMPEKSAEDIDQPWTDLQSHSDLSIDRNQLCATLIHCLTERLIQHQDEGLDAMIEQWHKQDVYLNKRVKLITGDRIVEGVCRGINNQGALMLEVEGTVKAIYGGEVSLRGAE
jgi:BirA family transcriptional regulator, biotin operon repressor / biotin---[acetyl-CoA-carboxylase] ligase